MSLIKKIFIFLIIAVLVILILNNFFLRSNIIWDDLVQGNTGQGGIQPDNQGLSDLSQIFPSSSSVPFPNLYTGSTSSQSTLASDTTQLGFAQRAGSSGLIVPNSAFPSIVGSNFMFSIWFFIDDYNQNISNVKFISSIIGVKSGGQFTPTIVTFLTPGTNDLGIGILTQGSTSNSQRMNFYFIQNIPLQKWNCLILSVVDRTMDVYLDGKLVNSYILGNFFVPLPRSSLYIGSNRPESFFSGFITRARYQNGAVNPQEAYSIYKEGIRTSFAGDFLNRYRLKVGLYEYNNKVGGFTI